MGPIVCPETSVRNYHYSLRNNPEERVSSSIKIINYELQEKQKAIVVILCIPSHHKTVVSRIKFPLGIKINTISFSLSKASGTI